MIKKLLFRIFNRDLFKEFGDITDMDNDKRFRLYLRLNETVNFKKLVKTRVTELSQVMLNSYKKDFDLGKDGKMNRIFLAGRVAQLEEFLFKMRDANKKATQLEKDTVIVEEYEELTEE